MRFRVQFGINLHEWVFQLFEKLSSANLFQIEREKSYDYLLIIQTWKNSRGKSAGRCFLKPFFAFENFFQSFRTKFLSLLYLISSTYKISHFLSDNHKPELRCVIYTGITLSAPVLHFLHWCYTWTVLLSANQNRVIFFMCMIGTFIIIISGLHRQEDVSRLNVNDSGQACQMASFSVLAVSIWRIR